MGVANIHTLAEERVERVDTAARVQEQADQAAAEQRRVVAESDAEHVSADQEVFATRAEVEQKFAEAREEIDARYAKKVETAEEQRLQQHSRNLEKREDAFGRVGLNPNGSDPHDRPQAVVDRESRRVVEATV